MSGSSAGQAAPEDTTVRGIVDVARTLGRLVIVTFGSQGVLAADGRPGGVDRFIPVDAVPVAGTTVGCGDAFVAAFLDAWGMTGGDLLAAVASGQGRGRRGDALAPAAPGRRIRRGGGRNAPPGRRGGAVRPGPVPAYQPSVSASTATPTPRSTSTDPVSPSSS